MDAEAAVAGSETRSRILYVIPDHDLVTCMEQNSFAPLVTMRSRWARRRVVAS